MGDRTVSNSKRDLQGHSTALAIEPFDRPHTISLSCTVSEIPTARCRSKIADLNLPHLYLAPPRVDLV